MTARIFADDDPGHLAGAPLLVDHIYCVRERWLVNAIAAIVVDLDDAREVFNGVDVRRAVASLRLQEHSWQFIRPC